MPKNEGLIFIFLYTERHTLFVCIQIKQDYSLKMNRALRPRIFDSVLAAHLIFFMKRPYCIWIWFMLYVGIIFDVTAWTFLKLFVLFWVFSVPHDVPCTKIWRKKSSFFWISCWLCCWGTHHKINSTLMSFSTVSIFSVHLRIHRSCWFIICSKRQTLFIN